MTSFQYLLQRGRSPGYFRRSYVQSLLGDHYQVLLADDGEAYVAFFIVEADMPAHLRGFVNELLRQGTGLGTESIEDIRR